MNPTPISGATKVLKAPAGWDPEKDGVCNDLYVRVEEGQLYASAWEPTPEDMTLLSLGGVIVLRVFGGQPPVSLAVELDVIERPHQLAKAWAKPLARERVTGVLAPDEIARVDEYMATYMRPWFETMTRGWDLLGTEALREKLQAVSDKVMVEGGHRHPFEVQVMESMRLELEGKG